MRTFQYFAIISLLCLPLSAEQKKYDKLLDYEDVTVREIKKDGIRIMHKAGFATVPIEKLPEAIRKELGLSMKGVEEYRKRTSEEKAERIRRSQINATNKKILKTAYMRIESAKVFQVVNGGVLAHVRSTWDGTYREVPQYKNETSRVGNALRGYRTVRRKVFTGNKKVKNTDYYDDWLVFVSCDNNGLVDGSRFSGDVWAAGRFSYTTAIGGGKTIPKYTANPDDITKR